MIIRRKKSMVSYMRSIGIPLGGKLFSRLDCIKSVVVVITVHLFGGTDNFPRDPKFIGCQ